MSILSVINDTNEGATPTAGSGSGFEQVADQIIDLETSLAEVRTIHVTINRLLLLFFVTINRLLLVF